MRRLLLVFLLCPLCFGLIFVEPASGYWVYTPKTGKWINPKSQPKDSPQDQMEYALSFYEAKDYKKAVKEFLRVVRFYPRSVQAPEAQIHAGLTYEALGRPYRAFQMYKKVAEVYPYSSRFPEAIERSFTIGDKLYEGEKIRTFEPVPLSFSGLDKAVEVFEHIVAQAPYGDYGDQAQFRLGQVHIKRGDYSGALRAFEKLVEEYPRSDLVKKSRYFVAFCAKKLSLEPGYDEEATDQAIEWFKDFKTKHPDGELAQEAEESLVALRAQKAEKLFLSAKFYARQKKWHSAALYYRKLMEQYSDTEWSAKAASALTELEKQGHISSTDS